MTWELQLITSVMHATTRECYRAIVDQGIGVQNVNERIQLIYPRGNKGVNQHESDPGWHVNASRPG